MVNYSKNKQPISMMSQPVQNPDVQIALLEYQIASLSTDVKAMTEAFKGVDERIRVMEGYVSRWKGASGVLLVLGAVLGWFGTQFVALWPSHH